MTDPIPTDPVAELLGTREPATQAQAIRKLAGPVYSLMIQFDSRSGDIQLAHTGPALSLADWQQLIMATYKKLLRVEAEAASKKVQEDAHE